MGLFCLLCLWKPSTQKTVLSGCCGALVITHLHLSWPLLTWTLICKALAYQLWFLIVLIIWCSRILTFNTANNILTQELWRYNSCFTSIWSWSQGEKSYRRLFIYILNENSLLNQFQLVIIGFLWNLDSFSITFCLFKRSFRSGAFLY